MFEILGQVRDIVIEVGTSDIISFGFLMFGVSSILKKTGFLSFFIIAYLGYYLTNNMVQQATNDPHNIIGLLKLSQKPTEKEIFTSLQCLRSKFDPQKYDQPDESIFIRLNEIREFFYRVGPLAAVDAFRMFGEIPNYQSIHNNLQLENQLELLKTSRSIDFVSNYFMLTLITFVFFYNSAARGFSQKFIVFASFIVAMIFEVSLGQPPHVLRSVYIPVEEYTDVTLGHWIGSNHLEIPKLAQVIRFVLIVAACQIYVYGLVYQPTAEEKLVSASFWYAWSLSQAYEELQNSYKEKGRSLDEFMMQVWNVNVYNHNLIRQQKLKEKQATQTAPHLDSMPGLVAGSQEESETKASAEESTQAESQQPQGLSPESPQLQAEPEPQGACSPAAAQTAATHLQRLAAAALEAGGALTAGRDFHRRLGRLMSRTQSYLVYGFVAFALYQKYQSQVDSFLFAARR